MPDPLTLTGATALLKLVGDLAKMVQDGRGQSREAKRLAGGILFQMRYELERNWKSLHDAYYGAHVPSTLCRRGIANRQRVQPDTSRCSGKKKT